MAGKVPMVGTVKAKAIAALRDEKKKAHDKKLLEAATRKELQESCLTKERSKKNARERDTIHSLSCSQNVDNAKELQFQGVESLQQGSKRKSGVIDVPFVSVDIMPTYEGVSKDQSCVVLSSTPPTPIVVLSEE